MGITNKTGRWPGGIIPYEFDPDVRNDVQRLATAQQALVEFMTRTSIRFVPWTTETDYVRFVYSPDGACSAGGAGKLGGEQLLDCNYDPTTWNITLHEVGHVVGLVHEHQRSDRDEYIGLDLTMHPSCPDGRFDLYDGLEFGSYDCNSVMHYDTTDPCITAKKCTTWGSFSGLSLGDAATVRAYYGTDDAPGVLNTASAVSRGPNTIDLFARTHENGIETTTWDSDVQEEWPGWIRIVDGQGICVSGVTAVSRHSKCLDAFVRAPNGGVYHASWNKDIGSKWLGWERVLDDSVITCTDVTAISRDSGTMDILFRGGDNGIYHAQWVGGIGGGTWEGWNRIGSGLGSSDVSVVSRGSSSLDVFIVGLDRSVFVASWDGTKPSNAQWTEWHRIGDGRAKLGASVAAVAIDSSTVHVIVVGEDGTLWAALWDGNHDAAHLVAWKSLGGMTAPNTQVTAVARGSESVDVFVLGTDHRVWTRAWHSSSMRWIDDWFPILDHVMAPGSGISAVARTPKHLDLFAVGGAQENYGIWSAAWDEGIAGGWRGWWRLTG